MPSPASGPVAPDDVATPMTVAPAKATSEPEIRRGGKPSPRKSPPRIAMRIGPTLTSIAAVPASTYRSPAFRTTL